ncbi:hypothetical protein CHLRE_08g373150v5 [Chlamydomonas reinhardtii]|uniref:Uncharacterized protein n=1 Tax=Chlamydomonas reinhardtii TaxID=3055 RepID=A0A2K3DHE4_CHLRE|nr:uncharacterized protein CHLRE_08g373150v5 [Chlamydomonas reinhardtii]PNW79941.1 hypothetical protein CHLRE_08g373150v5 [Chlamydomonas reinhardtii]
MQMRCTFSNLSPELIQKIASCLHPNDVAGALKLVNSETAAALGRYNKLVLGQKLEGNPIVYTGEPHRAELPWPGHAFVAHWGHHGPWRALSLRERRRLLCLAAASGHAASLGAALDHHGGALTPEVLVAAAAAGSLACCGRLLCEGCSVTFEAFRAAGQAGSVPVLQLLLQHIVYSPLSRRKAVVTAARGACAGGQAAALTWLQQACGHCIDEHDAIEAAQAGQAGLLELILPLLPEHMQHYGDAEPDLRRSRLLGAIAEGCTVEQLRRHYHPHLRRPRAERQAVRAATTEAPLIAPSATAAAAAGGAAAGAAAGEAAAAGGATGAPAAVPSPAPGGCDNALGGAALRRAPHVGASADTAGAAARPPEQWAMQASRAGDGAIDPWGEGASEEEGGEEHRSRGSHTDTDTDTDTAEEILEMMSQQSRELLSRLFNGAAASPTDCWRAKLDFLRNAWGPRRTRAAVIADDTECDVVRSATCGRPDFLQRLRYLHTELGVARGRTCAQFAAVGAAADALAYVWDECGVDMAHLRVQAPSALDEDTLDDLFFGANLDYSLMPVLRLLHERRVDLRARAAQLLDKAAPEAAACGDWDTADWLVEVVLAGVEVAGAEVEVETEVETEVVLASAEAEVEARPEREAAARRARWSRVFAAAAKAGARLAVLQGLAERGAAVDLAAVAQGGGEEALEWAAARLEAEAGAGALAQAVSPSVARAIFADCGNGATLAWLAACGLLPPPDTWLPSLPELCEGLRADTFWRLQLWARLQQQQEQVPAPQPQQDQQQQAQQQQAQPQQAQPQQVLAPQSQKAEQQQQQQEPTPQQQIQVQAAPLSCTPPLLAASASLALAPRPQAAAAPSAQAAPGAGSAAPSGELCGPDTVVAPDSWMEAALQELMRVACHSPPEQPWSGERPPPLAERVEQHVSYTPHQVAWLQAPRAPGLARACNGLLSRVCHQYGAAS